MDIIEVQNERQHDEAERKIILMDYEVHLEGVRCTDRKLLLFLLVLWTDVRVACT